MSNVLPKRPRKRQTANEPEFEMHIDSRNELIDRPSKIHSMNKTPFFIASLVLSFAFLTNIVFAQKPETVRCDVTRDLWISSVPGEEDGNNGKSPRLKLKGYQEFSLLDFDLSAVKNRRIHKATLHVKISGQERLYRVGVSSLGSEWIEGAGSSYAKNSGASSFRLQTTPGSPWTTQPGYSDVTRVMFGQGGTLWSHADATPPDSEGWQTIDVDTKVVAARLAGLSYGFVVFDDTGTEIRRDADDPEKVVFRPFPNRFFYSRDQNAASAPYLTLETQPQTPEPAPQSIRNIKSDTENLAPGQAVLTWEIPALDDCDTLGFIVRLNGEELPRFAIPVPDFAAINSPQTLTMPLRDLSQNPGENVSVQIIPVNREGIRGQSGTLSFSLSKTPKPLTIPEISKQKFRDHPNTPSPTLAGLDVSVIDELDKTTADGSLIPPRPDDYFAQNHLWQIDDDGIYEIRLDSLRNEFVAFQIRLTGKKNGVRPGLTWKTLGNDAPKTEFYRFEYVDSPKGKIADPMIPLGNTAIDVEGHETIYCEIFVPKNAEPGLHEATLRIADDSDTLDIPLCLTVGNAELPDRLGFLPEMNCYSLPQNERDYYRLAQVHRTYVNRVPYSHGGVVAKGCAPHWNAETRTFDWTDWDRRFGPCFDGSVFADLPRGAIPVEAFYLPLHENFPADIFKHYSSKNEGNDWAGEVLPPVYAEEFKAGCRAAAEHMKTKYPTGTCFHFFLNNKSDYKRNGWSRAGSMWLLDEPAAYRDFDALRYFGLLFREANETVKAPIHFRCDISRPQWQRESLDGLMGVNVVGGDTFRRFNRLINDRKDRFDEIVYVYGTTCKPEEGAVQPVAWCLDAWTLGADGLVPWQTVGSEESWTKSDELALFYPGREGTPPVVASHRLKAYRRGQQDVEYLILFQEKSGAPRWQIAETVRQTIPLAPRRRITYSEDAGTEIYSDLTPTDLWQLRTRLR